MKRTVLSLLLISLLATGQAVVVPSSDAELVAYWPLDEGTGTEINDVTGHGYNGTIMGNPEWVKGVVGSALEFDGDGDYVEIPGGDNINPETITVAMWVYFNGLTANRQDFFSRNDDYGIAFDDEDNGPKMLIAVMTSGGGWQVLPGKTVIEPEKGQHWYHVAMTYSADTKMFILYLNGEKEGEKSIPAGLAHRFVGFLTLGTLRNRFLYGGLDEISIWDEALSEDQIKASMEPSPVEPAGKLSLIWGEIKNSR